MKWIWKVVINRGVYFLELVVSIIRLINVTRRPISPFKRLVQCVCYNPINITKLFFCLNRTFISYYHKLTCKTGIQDHHEACILPAADTSSCLILNPWRLHCSQSGGEAPPSKTIHLDGSLAERARDSLRYSLPLQWHE